MNKSKCFSLGKLANRFIQNRNKKRSQHQQNGFYIFNTPIEN